MTSENEVLFQGICGYGRGFHGPIRLFIGTGNCLSLSIDGKLVWSSDMPEMNNLFMEVQRLRRLLHDGPPRVTDGTGWAEAAFDALVDGPGEK